MLGGLSRRLRSIRRPSNPQSSHVAKLGRLTILGMCKGERVGRVIIADSQRAQRTGAFFRTAHRRAPNFKGRNRGLDGAWTIGVVAWLNRVRCVAKLGPASDSRD